MAENKKKPGSPQSIAAVMYLGPHRPYGLSLMNRQVFTGTEPPPFCKALFAKRPHFAACFVPVLGAGKAIKELGDPKSSLSRAAAKVGAESAMTAEELQKHDAAAEADKKAGTAAQNHSTGSGESPGK